MSWNDPFETLVETLVDDLGAFLQAKGTLAIHEVARTQEVCRDFCKLFKRDVRTAAPSDFEAYLEMHSSTPQNRADYSNMLDNIRDFCANGTSLAPIENENRVQPSGNNRPRSKRDRISTRQFDPNSDVMKELFVLGGAKKDVSISASSSDSLVVPKELGNSAKASQANLRAANRVSVNSGLFFPDFGNPDLQDTNASTNNPAATPHRPLDAVPEKGKKDADSKKFNKFDFSMDGDLANEFRDSNEITGRAKMPSSDKATPHTPVSGVRPVVGLGSRKTISMNDVPSIQLSDLFEQNDDDDDVKPRNQVLGGNPQSELIGSVSEKKSTLNSGIARAYAEVDAAANNESQNSAPEAEKIADPSDDANKNDRMRGVSGVEYNFSQDSLRKMRDDVPVSRKDKVDPGVSPIDKSLINGFKPYVFDVVYTIDIPLANPDEMKPASTSFVDRFIIPLAAPVLLICLALFIMSFAVVVGVPFIILAVITFFFGLPEIMPPVQQTPQATLDAFLGAKNGRCYSRAMSLLAVPKKGDDQDEIDFHELWEPEKSWPAALFSRFKSPELPEARIITGSERTNAVLLLIPLEDEKQYTLLPLVRLNSKWYITDPKMTVRNKIR